MTERGYLAAIEVLVRASGKEEAAEKIAHLLGDESDEHWLLDWNWLDVAGRRAYPKETLIGLVK